MADARSVWMTDRWGVQHDVATLEGFLAAHAALDPDDAEHAVVSLEDSNAWFLECSIGTASFGSAVGDEEHDAPIADAEALRSLASAFLNGDLDAVRRAVRGT